MSQDIWSSMHHQPCVKLSASTLSNISVTMRTSLIGLWHYLVQAHVIYIHSPSVPTGHVKHSFSALYPAVLEIYAFIISNSAPKNTQQVFPRVVASGCFLLILDQKSFLSPGGANLGARLKKSQRSRKFLLRGSGSLGESSHYRSDRWQVGGYKSKGDIVA